MPVELEKAVGKFRSQVRHGKVYSDGKQSEVEITYKPGIIEIKNLEEMYPVIRIMTNNSGQAEGSIDGKKWVSLPKEDSEGIQILRLLDPSFVFPHTSILEMSLKPMQSEFYGIYKLDNLPLPKDVAKDYGMDKSHREVTFRIKNQELTEIVQNDLPPFSEEIAVKFNNKK